MAHACELETSLYLAIRPELVQMDRAVRETSIGSRSTPGWTGRTGRSVKGQWSGWTESGVIGDATAATVEKGRAWLERAVEEICEYIDDMAGRRARPGQDHHMHAVAANPREDDV
jgi:creatinine amidohydrolase